jgi:hypothetical protein
MSKFQIILIISVILLALIVLISFVFLSFRPSKGPSLEASTMPSMQSTQRTIDKDNVKLHPQQGGVYQTISSEAAQMIDRDRKIGQFIKKLPHRAENFSLIYDIDTNSFIAELSSARRAQANRELDQFLQENGIMERSWLYNFTIKQQTY